MTTATIPNYWTYAENFVLQDRMFAPTDSWTLPAHLFLVSGVVGALLRPARPDVCVSHRPAHGDLDGLKWTSTPELYAWTDITWLLHEAGVSWGYYVGRGTCAGRRTRRAEGDTARPAGTEPAPGFTTSARTGQHDHILDARGLLADRPPTGRCRRSRGSCRATARASTRHGRAVAAGQAHVTKIVNSVMRGPTGTRSAIFLTWDDWGGFYDHVRAAARRRERVRAPGAGPPRQPLGDAPARSTTRRSRSTPT